MNIDSSPARLKGFGPCLMNRYMKAPVTSREVLIAGSRPPPLCSQHLSCKTLQPWFTDRMDLPACPPSQPLCYLSEDSWTFRADVRRPNYPAKLPENSASIMIAGQTIY